MQSSSDGQSRITTSEVATNQSLFQICNLTCGSISISVVVASINIVSFIIPIVVAATNTDRGIGQTPFLQEEDFSFFEVSNIGPTFIA